jgi:hypothetical protein
MTLGIDIQHSSIECHYAECCYAECRNYLNVTLSVVRQNVVMLNVVVPILDQVSAFKKMYPQKCW